MNLIKILFGYLSLISGLDERILFSESDRVENINYINEHNSMNLSYTLGKNDFIEYDFINETYPINKGLIYSNIDDNATLSIFSETDEQNLIEEIDWRENNAVTSVKNQGECGGCWSFSAVGAVEGLWAIKNGNLFHKNLYNLSEQELIDCSGSYGNHGCEGGTMLSAFGYIKDNGLCLEKDYQYTGEDGQCQKDNCESKVKISNYSIISPNSETQLQRAVQIQPVSVAIQANKRSFQFYKSGIYSDLDCGFHLDHGVLLIGYGYDKDLDMKYWIIKNSWGNQWGENGYIRIQKDIDDDRGLCGIAMQPSIPLLR